MLARCLLLQLHLTPHNACPGPGSVDTRGPGWRLLEAAGHRDHVADGVLRLQPRYRRDEDNLVHNCRYHDLTGRRRAK